MSQQDNFFGGFLLGTIFGGAVGGVVGVLVANRLAKTDEPEILPAAKTSKKLEGKSGERRVNTSSPQSIETARRGLEDKIAQLNEAIDDVRYKLGSMNGVAKPENPTQPMPERKN